jgi:hypothetical protein
MKTDTVKISENEVLASTIVTAAMAAGQLVAKGNVAACTPEFNDMVEVARSVRRQTTVAERDALVELLAEEVLGPDESADDLPSDNVGA